MAIQTFYRGIRFSKEYIIKYIKSIFIAAERGQLVLTDGTVQIEFSNTPFVNSLFSWDEQHLPAVLIGDGNVISKPISIAKDFALSVESEIETDDQWDHYSGNFYIDFTISVRARSMPERDNLVDIVTLYLSHPMAKDFLEQHGIQINKHPTVGGHSQLRLPGIDFPLYTSSITFGIISTWDYREEISGARLRDICVDIIAQISLD